MNETMKKKLRTILLACYDLDIDEAKCYFSTQNYAFIFEGKPYMIRVSMTSKKTRAEILSELMWVDDLKQFKQTICEPSCSVNGKMLEEFEIDGTVYRASMFRTARGVVKPMSEMTPMYFICVGDLLGTIHKVSADERRLGMHFRRPHKADQFAAYKERTFSKLAPEVCKKILDIEQQVNALPRELGQYGLCHGDFHNNNFFVEENNVWLFDFDGCAYCDYMYDVACFIQDCLFKGYGKGKDARAVIEQDILPYLKLGYELNKKDGQTAWDRLELMIAYRTCISLMSMAEIEECGVMDIQIAKDYFHSIIMQEDLIAAMTRK